MDAVENRGDALNLAWMGGGHGEDVGKLMSWLFKKNGNCLNLNLSIFFPQIFINQEGKQKCTHNVNITGGKE